MTLVALLMLVLIAVIAWWLITKFITAQPAQNIVLAVVGIILLIVLLQGVGVLGGDTWHLRVR
jgi:hypothetical protein